jgi:hypothetical protein
LEPYTPYDKEGENRGKVGNCFPPLIEGFGVVDFTEQGSKSNETKAIEKDEKR